MKGALRLAFTVVLMLTFLGAVGLRARAADSPATGLKIGTIDLQRVVDQYQKRKDLEEELKKYKADTASALQVLQKQVDAVKSELDLLSEASPDYDKKKRELEEKREVLVLKGRLAERDVVQRWAKDLEAIYNEILNKVDQFREKAGYDLLLRVDTAPLKATSLEDMREHLNRKMVLSRIPSLDVTDQVIEFLNRK